MTTQGDDKIASMTSKTDIARFAAQTASERAVERRRRPPSRRDRQMVPKAPRITQKLVKAGLKGRWFLDPRDHCYECRHANVLGGSVGFHQQRHTGIKGSMLFRVTYYTGVPAARWAGMTFDTLKEAVAFANEHRQTAMNATAAELGDDFMERERSLGDD